MTSGRGSAPRPSQTRGAQEEASRQLEDRVPRVPDGIVALATPFGRRGMSFVCRFCGGPARIVKLGRHGTWWCDDCRRERPAWMLKTPWTRDDTRRPLGEAR